MNKVNSLGKVQEYIEELESRLTWISVEDRLPEGESWTKYLVAFKIGDKYDIAITMFNSQGFIDGDFNQTLDFITHPITHWMPLPEPPNE